MKNFLQKIKDIEKNGSGNDKYGLLRVTVNKNLNTKIGFSWMYLYFDIIEGKPKSLSSIDLKYLRKRLSQRV